MHERNKQELVQVLTEMVECWEHWHHEVTVEQVRKITRSSQLSQIVAHTMKDPVGAFADHLEKMALCMKV